MLTEIIPVGGKKNLSSVKYNTDFILRTVCVDRKSKREKEAMGKKGGRRERAGRGRGKYEEEKGVRKNRKT